MIECTYYSNYQGPPLIKAVLDYEDVIDRVNERYGEQNNWKGYLYTFKEIFGEKCNFKHFQLEFKYNAEQQIYTMSGYINDINQYMNPPLYTPISKKLTQEHLRDIAGGILNTNN